jgi:hypothetical protein
VGRGPHGYRGLGRTRLIGPRPHRVGEHRLCTGLVATALLVMTAGFISIKTGRDALYLQGAGLFGVPKAFTATALGAIPQAMAILWAVRPAAHARRGARGHHRRGVGVPRNGRAWGVDLDDRLLLRRAAHLLDRVFDGGAARDRAARPPSDRRIVARLLGASCLGVTLILVLFAQHRFDASLRKPKTEDGKMSSLWGVMRRGGLGLPLAIAMAAAVSGIRWHS